MEELLDYHRIKTWAKGKPKGSEVGVACTNTQCPLANYLGEMTNKLWSVGPSIRTMNGTTRDRLDKPVWIQELIERVDLATGGQHKPISREQFLRILNDTKVEEK